MAHKKILTIILALVMLMGSVTPVMAETRGDPVVRSIIEDDELVPTEGSGSQEKPPIVTVLPSGNDDELVPGEDPNDKLIPAEDPNDKLVPAETSGDEIYNPDDN